MTQDDDWDRSVERWLKAEYRLIETAGFGVSKQGIAFSREHAPQLTQYIAAERLNGRRNLEVWEALRGLDDREIAFQLLTSGIDVCYDEERYSIYQKQAIRIGSDFCDQLSNKAKYLVGDWGISALLTLPDFNKENDILTLPPTDTVDRFLNAVVELGICRSPKLVPQLTKLVPWTGFNKGALPADHRLKISLVTRAHASQKDAVRYAIGRGQMNTVLAAVNTLQEVPITINEPLRKWTWKYLAPLPFDPRLPPPAWGKVQRLRGPHGKARMKRTIFERDLILAEQLSGDRYVPGRLDFRRRVYGLCDFSFQSSPDHVRSLLLFAHGKPIGIEGFDWLKQYVAASADKWDAGVRPSTFNFKDRVTWTDENLPRLLSVAEAVLNGDPISKLPKKPVRFLAACLELKQALDIGPSFETRLPLRFDGSNNALQHMAAMMRAPEGRYVNLVASDAQEDFYRRVAEMVWKTCPDLMEGPQDRDLMKAGCVPWLYGSRAGGFIDDEWIGMADGIAEELRDRRGTSKGAGRLAHATQGAIKELAPCAVRLHKFLRRLVRLYHQKGKSLHWRAPAGFPCVNAYYIAEIIGVETRCGKNRSGRHRHNIVVGDTDEIDLKGAQRAVSANFVHSLDAAHLQRVVVAADFPLLTAHDCFAARAPDAAQLNYILRHEFEKMYTEHDPIAEILAIARRDLPGVKLPFKPRKGKEDLSQCRDSFFMFAS